MTDRIDDLRPDLLAAAHALNQRYTTEISVTSPAELAALVGKATYARCVGRLEGFLLAFDAAAGIEGLNYGWFKARYDDFLYVDRIAVDPAAQGRGVARRLYADLIAWAGGRGYARICCEVNVRPPNPASDRLHASLGFVEIAERELPNGKRVRYLERALR